MEYLLFLWKRLLHRVSKTRFLTMIRELFLGLIIHHEPGDNICSNYLQRSLASPRPLFLYFHNNTNSHPPNSISTVCLDCFLVLTYFEIRLTITNDHLIFFTTQCKLQIKDTRSWTILNLYFSGRIPSQIQKKNLNSCRTTHEAGQETF